MTCFVDKDAVLALLSSEAAFQRQAIKSAEGDDASRQRRHAHSKLSQIERLVRLISDMQTFATPAEPIAMAPPKSEWNDRAFLAVALTESQPAARNAVTRLLTDMNKPVDFLHQEFKEQHRKKMARLEREKANG
jgi:hypothetical protein